jgi:hypothetical protein
MQRPERVHERLFQSSSLIQVYRRSRNRITAALAGHLCRCGAYASICKAVVAACAGRFDAAEPRGPRVEAVEKVIGRAKYTVDIALEGQLEGAILRSPHAHARVVALDLVAVRKLPDVAAAISLLGPDQTVRFAGQEVAAVAATNWKTARAALDAIVVRYEILPAAIGVDEARRVEAPRVFSGFRKTLGNVSEGPMLPTRAAMDDRPRTTAALSSCVVTSGLPIGSAHISHPGLSRSSGGNATDFATQLSGTGWQRTDVGSQGTSVGFASPYLRK